MDADIGRDRRRAQGAAARPGARRAWWRSCATRSREAAAAAGVTPARSARWGSASPGQCLGATGVVLNAPNLGWRDVAFGELLERAVGVPVRVANDLSVAAWGEKRFGAAKGIDDVVLVFVGSGVGSGLILGGRLHDGAQGVAGEFGHVKVRPLARGDRGAPLRLRPAGLPRGVHLRHERRGARARGDRRGRRDRDPRARRRRSRARQREPGRRRRRAPAMPTRARSGRRWRELLGTAIANLVTLLNPARLILGGGVLLGCPALAGLVRAALRRGGLRLRDEGALDRARLARATTRASSARRCSTQARAARSRTLNRKLVATAIAAAPRRLEAAVAPDARERGGPEPVAGVLDHAGVAMAALLVDGEDEHDEPLDPEPQRRLRDTRAPGGRTRPSAAAAP